MAGFSIKVNRNVLESEMQRILGEKPRYLLREARDVAEKAMEGVKRSLLAKYDSLEVNKEIKRGPHTRDSILPTGNLFSFLGFYADTDPVGKLRKYLQRSIDLKEEPTYNRRLKKYYFRVNRPDENDIGEATEGDLEWASFSGWPNAIEEGVSNLNHYFFLYNKASSQSHSTRAFQKPFVVNPGADFGGTTYLSQLWDFLEDKLGKSIN